VLSHTSSFDFDGDGTAAFGFTGSTSYDRKGNPLSNQFTGGAVGTVEFSSVQVTAYASPRLLFPHA
jgi:hypothetical protein